MQVVTTYNLYQYIITILNIKIKIKLTDLDETKQQQKHIEYLHNFFFKIFLILLKTDTNLLNNTRLLLEVVT